LGELLAGGESAWVEVFEAWGDALGDGVGEDGGGDEGGEGVEDA
jgi:hypothetical protein